MKILLPLAAFFALPFAVIAEAAQPSVGKAPLADTSGYFLQLVSGLGLVLLSIAVLAWLLKRINRLPNRELKDLELIASLSVGQRERVVIVRAGSTELVLGVAPGSISKLGEVSSSSANKHNAAIETTISKVDEEQHKTAFSTLMAKVRKDTTP
ncbi:MAG: flagellar biosynthetic protein FliO [Gammaproteobacteria bacterium]|nr:flagellar biosynthetic protein FliO [Gammaproteobacteria bacterium]MBQ0839542.1 flagellar biosynthetic protein FliO [Gammaproteobacteria bacterium]